MATKGELHDMLVRALDYLRDYRADVIGVEELDDLIEDIELALDPPPAAPVGRPKKEDAP